MNKIILYHGSTKIIRYPEFGKGKTYNDYGQGFYCTEHIDLAKEWACVENKNGFANKYELNMEDLKVLDLSKENYSILNWLAILMDNRIVSLNSPIQKLGRGYLLKNYLPDYKKYDVIKGYRADDSYFLFARSFVGNEISLEQLNYAMKLGELGEQFCIKSKKAFSQLMYKGYEIADNNIYYLKRLTRDEEARDSFQKELEKTMLSGVYIKDLMNEGKRR